MRRAFAMLIVLLAAAPVSARGTIHIARVSKPIVLHGDLSDP